MDHRFYDLAYNLEYIPISSVNQLIKECIYPDEAEEYWLTHNAVLEGILPI